MLDKQSFLDHVCACFLLKMNDFKSRLRFMNIKLSKYIVYKNNVGNHFNLGKISEKM